MGDAFFHWICGVLVFCCLLIMFSVTWNLFRSKRSSDRIVLLVNPGMIAASALLLMIGAAYLWFYLRDGQVGSMVLSIFVFVLFLESYTDFFVTFKDERLFLGGYHIDYDSIRKVEFKKFFGRFAVYMVISYGAKSKKVVWICSKAKDRISNELEQQSIEVCK